MLEGRKKTLSFAKDGAILTASTVLTQVIALINTMLLSRSISTGEYGTYSQILMVINIVMTVVMLGLPSSLNFFLAKYNKEEEKSHFLSLYYTVSTILSIILGIVLVLSVPIIENSFNNEAISLYLYFIAIYPWTKIIQNSIDNLCVVYHKVVWLTLFKMLHGLAIMGCLLVVVKWFSLPFSTYMKIVLCVESFFALVVYMLANKLCGVMKPIYDGTLLKEILSFSIPLGLTSAIGTISAELGKLIISLFENAESVAIYTNAAKELPITFISTSFTAVLLPKVVRMIDEKKLGDAVNLWKNVTSFSLIINTFFSIGLFVFSFDAVCFLYSDQYAIGATVFGICSLTYIVRSTYFGLILNALKETKYILYINVFCIAINTILGFVFYFCFGFVGPAVATVFTTYLMAYLMLMKTKKIVNIKIREIYPWKELIKNLFVNLVLGVGACVVKVNLQLQQQIGEYGETFAIATVWLILIVIIFRRSITEKWNLFKKV